MNPTVELTEVREFMKRHLVEVFETMLSRKAVPSGAPVPETTAERVCSSVGFGGETVTGVAYLHLSGEFASTAAAAMLGMADEVPVESEVNDVVGELSNMLAGGLKSHLADLGLPCAVSTPTIIRGTCFAIESLPDVKRERLAFECGREFVVLEIHIKFEESFYADENTER